MLLRKYPYSFSRNRHTCRARTRHACEVLLNRDALLLYDRRERARRAALARLQKILVMDQTVSVLGDDQGHHVFEVELESLESDFFIHVFDFPV